MTISEFNRFLYNQAISEIVLYSGNQSEENDLYPLRLDLIFSRIRVSISPNTVYLQEQGNTISFCNVKRIEIDTGKSVLGTVVNLCCESLGKEHVYTLVLKVR